MNLEEFLNLFYNTITFENEEQFKSELFKSLFHEHALLIEKNDDVKGYTMKTIDDHIKEFEIAIQKYPQLFIKGFHENQLEYETICTENYIMVNSKYQKTYSRNNEEVTTVGNNMMTLIRGEDSFKIVSIAW